MIKIQQINGNYTFAKDYNNQSVAFCAKRNNLERSPESDCVETRNQLLKKVGIGAAAVALLAGISFIMAAKKGKNIKFDTEGVRDNVDKLQKQVKKRAQAEQNGVEQNAEKLELPAMQEAVKTGAPKSEIRSAGQNVASEKENSAFLKQSSGKEEKCNIIEFDVPISDAKFGNNIDLDWYLSRYKQSEFTRKILEECKDLTFDSPNLRLIKDFYDADNIYDLGLRYAIVANNTARTKGSSVLINEIPEMFKGTDRKELIRKLDLLPSFLEKTNKFKVGEREYRIDLVGSGCISDVYKITDLEGNAVCYKYARDPYLMGTGQGIYNEFAILNEANKAGVIDVPKLYMGNPVGSVVQNPNVIGTTTKGAWQIVEFVEHPLKSENGLMLIDWLSSKNLRHGDMHTDNIVLGKVVDLGGIYDKAETVNLIKDDARDVGWLFRAYHKGLSSQEIINMMDRYSKISS